MDTTKYIFDFNGGTIYTTFVQRLANFYDKRLYSEQVSFIWVINKTTPDIVNIKDEEGKYICIYDHKLNIQLLFGRPIFFDQRIEENIIEFRAYR
jgi:hypothetical protein